MSGRTIREAIAVALEGLSGSAEEWLLASNSEDKQRLRSYVRTWVHEYAAARGVILEDRDIDTELQDIVNRLRDTIKKEQGLI